MKRGILTAFFLMAFLAVSACACEAEEYVPTAEWEPPVINEEEVSASEPWLLVLKTAQEEIGYVEGPHEDETKYGEYMGDRLTAWCAEFLTWCVNETDERYGTRLMDDVYPYYGHPKKGAPWFIQRERFISSTGKLPTTGEKMWMIGGDRYLKNKEYIPHAGDYMWFAWYTPKKGTDHVALVEGVSVEPDGSYLVHVIEGNNPDRVQRNTYPLTYKLIYGYGTPVRRANRVIRTWNRTDDCKAVMQFLYQNGYLKEKDLSEQFTDKGFTALKKFQKENGLKISGKVDIETRTLIEHDPDFRENLARNQR
ncbi:MAG: CHAP domain-containing protein [Clostridia bacterium]|nr:CHAP domain-containing protein [Clostridia bacterium]